MSDFYKFEIANWNEGTANLTLEQEAAYLRIINAIRLSEQPITFNIFVLCGLWRCNERKAKRILQELIDAGKVRVEDGKIINDKAVEDASNLRGLRVERASAGRRGGIESGKSRSKALENNNTAEAIASTREEKRREEKKEEREADASPKKSEDVLVREALLTVLDPETADAFIAHRNSIKAKLTLKAAELTAKSLVGHPDPKKVINTSIMNRWTGVFPDRVKADHHRQPSYADQQGSWFGGKPL